jgi:hypothetical protein
MTTTKPPYPAEFHRQAVTLVRHNLTRRSLSWLNS